MPLVILFVLLAEYTCMGHIGDDNHEVNKWKLNLSLSWSFIPRNRNCSKISEIKILWLYCMAYTLKHFQDTSCSKDNPYDMLTTQ